jgi:hypothetical protein
MQSEKERLVWSFFICKDVRIHREIGLAMKKETYERQKEKELRPTAKKGKKKNGVKILL